MSSGSIVSAAASHPVSNTVRSRRIGGLDTIRFVSASVVLLGHLNLLVFPNVPRHGLGKALHGLHGVLFNGPAAVIVFFVVSGFCIHYPFRDARQLNVSMYLSRRLIRIGLPSLAFIAYSLWVLSSNPFTTSTVLWSIQCEIIYYCLYPLLLLAARRTSWLALIVSGYGLAFAVSLTHLQALREADNAYIAFGSELTWLIGLPTWLLGCYLAENFQKFRLPSVTRIWMLRSGVFMVSVLLRIAKFHIASPLASNCITLNLFAILVCYWIGYEIAYCSQRGINRWLESAGAWSYSIYLVHPLADATIILLGGHRLMSQSEFAHLLGLAVIYAAAYLFYLLVEKPSHRFASRFCKIFQNRPLWMLTVPQAPSQRQE